MSGASLTGFLILCGVLTVLLLCVQVFGFRKLRTRARRGAEPQATVDSPASNPGQPKESVWPFVLLAAWIVFALVRGLQISNEPWDARVVPPTIAGLESSVKEFATLGGLRETLSGGQLNGKIIVIDRAKMTLHPLTRGLPKSRVARAPDEVKIVVLIEPARIYALDLGWFTGEQANLGPIFRAMSGAKPSSTIPAYRAKWKVKVIDLKTKEVRYAKTFTGPEPPGTRVTIRLVRSQWVVFEGERSVYGAEILSDDKGVTTGLVGAVPWDETLAWVKQAVGIGTR